MVEIIMDMCTHAIENVESNRIQIRVDDLDVETFDKVFDFVANEPHDTHAIEPPYKRKKV